MPKFQLCQVVCLVVATGWGSRCSHLQSATGRCLVCDHHGLCRTIQQACPLGCHHLAVCPESPLHIASAGLPDQEELHEAASSLELRELRGCSHPSLSGVAACFLQGSRPWQQSLPLRQSVAWQLCLCDDALQLSVRLMQPPGKRNAVNKASQESPDL